MDYNDYNYIAFNMSSSTSMVGKYSSIQKLLHVIAYCLRFYYKVVCKGLDLVDALSAREANIARIIIIKYIQKEAFTRKIRELNNLKKVTTSSKLFRLCQFMNEKE